VLCRINASDMMSIAFAMPRESSLITCQNDMGEILYFRKLSIR
jgi:hypothetical protein